jgi:hypothetical protein
MQFKNLPTTLQLTPMSKAEAGALVKRMLGSYPSLNLHDPETYIATICTLLTGYPLWAAEIAVDKATVESKYIPPTPGILKPHLEELVRTPRYLAQWDKDAKLQALPPPPGPSAEERRAFIASRREKYGPDWVRPWRPQQPTREQARDALIAQIGQEAFDATPDAGFTTDEWKKLQGPQITEGADQ